MQVRFESRTPDGALVQHAATRRVRFGMRRLCWLVPRVRILLSDVNGARGGIARGSLARMLDASVTSAVLDRTSVPVEVIAGEKLSALERYGVPAGIGAVILVFVLALE